MMRNGEEAVGCGPIEDRIRRARELYARWGDDLRRDQRIKELLATLRRTAASSREAMHDAGVAAVCRSCEEEDGGSCCGRGIEDKYDPGLLLINMLLGCSLPERRQQANSCYFLGREGCCLEARHVICVNYLCRKIQDLIPVQDLIHVQQVNGEELDTAFVLGETIKRFMSE